MQDRCTHGAYHILRNQFGLLDDVCHIESHFGLLEIVLVSVQDRYTVCA